MPDKTSRQTDRQVMILLWALPVLLGLEVMLAWLVLHLSWLQAADGRLSARLSLDPDSPLQGVVSWITTLGSGSVVLPVLFIISLGFLVQEKRWQAASLWGGFLSARLVTDGLKHLVARPRPALPELGYSPDGWDTLSFPSGHTTSAVFLYGFIALFCLAPLSSPGRRKAVAGVLVLVAVSVGISRVVLGRHFATDVLGGVISGGIGLVVARLIAWRWHAADPQA